MSTIRLFAVSNCLKVNCMYFCVTKAYSTMNAYKEMAYAGAVVFFLFSAQTVDSCSLSVRMKCPLDFTCIKAHILPMAL